MDICCLCGARHARWSPTGADGCMDRRTWRTLEVRGFGTLDVRGFGTRITLVGCERRSAGSGDAGECFGKVLFEVVEVVPARSAS
eukprot:5775680-Pyramimonas_sp.AAC.1